MTAARRTTVEAPGRIRAGAPRGGRPGGRPRGGSPPRRRGRTPEATCHRSGIACAIPGRRAPHAPSPCPAAKGSRPFRAGRRLGGATHHPAAVVSGAGLPAEARAAPSKDRDARPAVAPWGPGTQGLDRAGRAATTARATGPPWGGAPVRDPRPGARPASRWANRRKRVAARTSGAEPPGRRPSGHPTDAGPRRRRATSRSVRPAEPVHPALSHPLFRSVRCPLGVAACTRALVSCRGRWPSARWS